MNVVALVGRLVADPELRYTPSGVAVATLRIAVDRRFKNEAGEKESDFFDVIAWKQRAEFASNYLAKGQRVAISGSLQQRSWVQQDGQKRWKVEVIAENIQGLDRPQGGQGAPPPSDESAPRASAPPSAPAEAETDMDYDPFAEE